MTLVVPNVWVAGETVTAAKLGTVTDGIRQLQGYAPSAGALDFAVLYQTVTQSLTSGTWAAITFDTESVDAAGGHSTVTNTSRYTAVHTGWYQINAGVAFAINATGSRSVRLQVNGTAIFGRDSRPATAATIQTECTLARKVFLTAGQYIEVAGWQNSGGALSTSYGSPEVTSFLDVQWVHS